MSAEPRFEPAQVPGLDGSPGDWGVVDHHGFKWVKDHRGRIRQFPTREAASVWIGGQPSELDAGARMGFGW